MTPEGVQEQAAELKPGMPVLLLTADDPLAPAVARHYAQQLAAASRPPGEIALAEQSAAAMEHWLRDNPPKGQPAAKPTADPRDATKDDKESAAVPGTPEAAAGA
jgi:hypothetical protein